MHYQTYASAKTVQVRHASWLIELLYVEVCG